MDINGYQVLLRVARCNTYADAQPPLFEYQIKDISYKELKHAFRRHGSWSALNDENSELMTFLKTVCMEKESVDKSGDNMRFSSFMLRTLGLLWCDGNIEEKVVEFYDILQDNN